MPKNNAKKKSTISRRKRRTPAKTRELLNALGFESLEQRVCMSVTYATPIHYAQSANPDFVTAGDFNSDGKKDLATSSFAGSNVSIMLGGATGTFGAATSISLTAKPDFITNADLNGDGKLDLITVSYTNNSVGVMLGNGNGTFQTAVNYSAGTGPRAVALGDFNSDGKTDLAVAKSFATSLTILRGNGDGTFQAPLNSTLTFAPVDLVAGDFNSDGKTDLAAADYFNDKIQVLIGNGNATFAAPVGYVTGMGPTSIAAGDLSGDGKFDLVTAGYGANKVSVLKNNGDGTFGTATHYTAGTGTTFVSMADLDGDGTLDVVAANATSDNVSVFFGNGAGALGNAVTYKTSTAPRSVALANFNNDSGIDIAVANSSGKSTTVLLTNGTPITGPVADAGGPYTVTENGTVTLNGASSVGNGLTYAWDLDGDGVFGEAGETGATPSFSAAGLDGPTSKTVSLKVTDSASKTSTDTATVTVSNAAPTLTLGGNTSTTAGTAYTLTLSETDPGDDTISKWVINWGDGNVVTLTGNPTSTTHTYGAAGTFTISATATDEDGTYNTPNKSLTVAAAPPAPPVANAGGPYTVAEGGTVALSGSKSTGTTLTYTWDLDGDGVFGETGTGATRGTETGATPSFNAAGLDGTGTQTVSLKVTDSANQTNTATATINITNAAPTLTLGGAVTVNEAATYTLTLGATDPGSDTISKWVINWGDGSAAQTVTGNPSSVTHVFADSGSYTIAASATDEDGTYNAASKTITVANVAPTLTIGGAASVAEGATYTLTLGATDPAPDTITQWVITWGDGTAAQTVTGNPSSVTHVFADNGSFTITAKATDEDGTYTAATKAVSVTNVAPTVTIGGAATAATGVTYTLGLAETDPGTDTVTKWVVTWGDGSAAETVTGNPSSVAHTFTKAGSFSVTATATDEDGTFNSNTQTVVVSAAAFANAGGPYTVLESGSVALSGAGSVGPGLTYAWDLDGDGTFGETGSGASRGDETGATPTFDATGQDGPSSKTVSLRVTDSNGISNTGTATINITNIAPTLSIDGAASGNEGAVYTLNLGATDPSNDTIAKWVITWGDGSAAQTVTGNPSSVTHTFADNGTYTISATATDEDGTYNSNSKSVAIANVAPTVAISGAATSNEGASYTLALAETDPGSDTISKWVINWGDGSAAQTVTGNPASTTHTFADDGSYTITATATDEDGTFSANSVLVAVAKVDPTLTLSGNATVNEGASYTLNLGKTDPGADTISAWVINWGDGSAAQTVTGSPASTTHVFADNGSYTISASATDEDGTYTSNNLSVTVSNVAPTLTLSGNASMAEGGTYTLNLGKSDPGADTISAWVINWGDGSAAESITGSPASATHKFADNGTYSITATATDDDGTYTAAAKSLSVTNVAPTVSISGASTLAEGSIYTLSLASSDPGPDTISKWVITWGDGNTETITGNPSEATHKFADNGSYTISATATDEDGTYSAGSKAITVSNVAPTVTISGNSVASIGTTYTLGLAETDPGADAVTKWVVTWGDGSSAQTVTGNPSSVTHTFSKAGSYTISANATDEDGSFNSNTTTVTVGAALGANAGGPYSVAENGKVALNGAASTGTGLTYAWDLDGDGTFGETGAGAARGDEVGATPTFDATGLDGPSSKTVSLRVTDALGATNTGTATINITNVAPTLTISGAATGDEGSVYTLSLGATDPSADTISKWVITWGDGSAAQTVTGNPSSVTHTFADNGTYTINATATDEDGTYNANTKSVAIANVAPILTISGAATSNEGASYTLNFAKTDPGADTISKWVINWGDGSAAQTVTGSPASTTHTFADNGSYTVSATATDEDGTVSSNSITVAVANVAPTLTLSGAASVAEAATYTLNLGKADAGADTISKWVINWGDGSAAETITGSPSTATHKFADNGTYGISATATDEDGTFDAIGTSVSVTNVAPTVSISGLGTSAEGSSYTLALASSDPGADTINKWVINWGDGNTETITGNPVGASHKFADNGAYTISATATDEDGSYSAGTKAVTVSNVTPTITISGASSTATGSDYTLNLSAVDPGTDTISKWVITWGDGSAAQTITGNPSSATHTFSTAGNFTISAKATDEDGTFSSNTKAVAVSVAAAANAGGPYTVVEGGTVALTGAGSVGTGLTYTWDLDGDGTFGETGAGATRGNETGATPTFSAVGLDGASTQTVTLKITDGGGQTSTDTATINVTNVAPTVAISGAASVNEGATYTLALSSSDPGSDTISKWVINWGDGTAAQTVTGNPSSVTHAFADDGNYIITASATDEDGTYSANSKAVAVNNVDPSITISGNNAVAVNGSYTLTLGAADPGNDTVSKWIVNWGDGTKQAVNGNPESVTHTYDLGGSYTISATATDEDGTYDSNSLTLAVNNPAPVANAGGPYAVAENSTVALNGATSTGVGLKYSWDLDGDGAFGETGAGAVRGDEVGATPTYSAVGLDGGASKTIALKVTDSTGQIDTDSITLTIQNVAPTLTVSGPNSVNEGSSYTLTLGATDPGQDTISQWEIDWGDGNVQTIAGDVSTATHAYTDSGAYTIKAKATDEDGSYEATPKSVSVLNVAPTITLSGTNVTLADDAYTLGLGADDAGDDTISAWVVNWGDGTTDTLAGGASNATHAYTGNSANYVINVSATDEDGTHSAAPKSIAVIGEAPLAVAGGSYNAPENGSVSLSGAGSSGVGLTYSWDLDGDGVFGETGSGASRGDEVGATVTYDATGLDGPSTKTVTLKITDTIGVSSTDTATINITNVAPTVKISGGATVAEGSTYTLNLSSTETAGDDTVSKWTISWGDGNTETINGDPSTATHKYTDDGSYTISASATDEDGTYDAASTVNVSVTKVAPTLALSGSSPIAEGGTYTLNLESADPGDDTITKWVINWGDGSSELAAGNSATLTHQYADSGSYTITGTATDEDGTYTLANKSVVVTTVAPTLTISGNATVTEASKYTLNLGSTDAGNDTISKWVITWGDGNKQTITGNPSSATHAYADSGSYTVTATATDEDGSYSSNSQAVSVTNVAPTLTISGNDTSVEGSNYTLFLAAIDPGADTISKWVINWGDGTAVQTVTGNPSGVTHKYAGDGEFDITASATDEDGTYNATGKTVDVTDVAPILSIGGAASSNEGANYSLSLSAVDPGNDTISKWTINWGDGTAVETVTGNPSTVVHKYTDNGSYNVSATATDANGTYTANSKAVNVLNVDPGLTISGPSTTDAGAVYTLALSSSDVGTDTIDGWVIDWGDGVTEIINGNPESLEHTYAEDAGNVTISATVSDEDGSYDANPLSVAVITTGSDVAAPTAELNTAPSVVTAGGTTYTFTVVYADETELSSASIGNGDVRVTGPNSYNQVAQLVSKAAGSGGSIVATYRVTAPTSGWDSGDNGKYTISIESDQVFDTSGNAVAARAVGTFNSVILGADPIGNTMAAPTSVGSMPVGTVKVKADGVNTLDRNDYYKIVLTTKSTLGIKLSNMTDNADLTVYNEAGDRIVNSKKLGNSSEAFIVVLPAGTYYVRVVYNGDAGTTYRLRLQAAPPPPTASEIPGLLAAAPNLGAISHGITKTVNDTVGPSNLFDYYKFNVSVTTQVLIKLNGLIDGANLALLDSTGKALNTSSQPGTAEDSLLLNLAAGTYYARIQFTGGNTTPYKLQVAA